MVFVDDDLDIPIDVVMEGEFADPAAAPRPATAAAHAPRPTSAIGSLSVGLLDAESAADAAQVGLPQSREQTLARLLAQVRGRRRPRSAA